MPATITVVQGPPTFDIKGLSQVQVQKLRAILTAVSDEHIDPIYGLLYNIEGTGSPGGQRVFTLTDLDTRREVMVNTLNLVPRKVSE